MMAVHVQLTPAQLRALDFLYRAGWSSERAMAKAFYGDRRQSYRTAALIARLVDAGLAQPYMRRAPVRPGTRLWTLTDSGRSLAQSRVAS